MKRIFYIMIVLLLLFTSACSEDSIKEADKAANEAGKIKVYASIYPMYDFAKQIGKDKIDLSLMVPPGAEPHSWEPTAKLMAQMEEADVFIYNGVQMEMWVEKLIGSLSNENLIVVEASEGVDLLKLNEYDYHGHSEKLYELEDHDDHKHEKHHEEEQHHDHHYGEYDPHVWLDPIRAIQQAENIKNALVKADKKNEDFYEENFNEFADRLMKLDKKFREELNNRKLDEIVVAHAAFGYLAERYGLIQIAISGLNPQEEPSAAKMVKITELVKEYGIKYIFFEALTSPKLSEVLAKETGAKTSILNPIGGLTEEEINAGKDYITVMKENLYNLKKALN